MAFAKLVLGLAALNWLIAGLFVLALPDVNASIIEIELSTVSSYGDHRAVYGGLRFGIGCFLAWTLASGHLRPGLVATLALLCGNILGRLISVLADGVPGTAGLALLTSELIGVTLVGIALSRSNASTD